MEGSLPEKVGDVIGHILLYLPIVNYALGIVLSVFEFVFIRGSSFSMSPSNYPFLYYWVSITFLAASHVIIKQISRSSMNTLWGVILFFIFCFSLIASSMFSVICSYTIIQKIV
ncbi:MAG: hypothetical protein V1645_01355 [archaeon]